MEDMYYLLTIFLIALFSLLFAKKMSAKIGLVDVPRFHKKHSGSVPIVGGISIFSALFVGVVFFPHYFFGMEYFFVAASIVFFTGLLDDRSDLKVRPRLSLQVLAASIMAFNPDSILTSFGDIFNRGDVYLGMLSLPVTIIAVVGVINALNMVDGIDGLAGSLSLVSLGSISFLLLARPSASHELFFPLILTLLVSIVPYLLLNLSLFGSNHKVFLGDAGSMLIGFTLAWLLITLSQDGDGEITPIFHPVTALWMFAVPLVDAISIMVRRLIKGQSPFLSDRGHLHHIIMRIGYSDRQALVAIVSLSIFLSFFGILMEFNKVSEFVSFVFFLVFFALYLLGLLHVFKLTKIIRNAKRKMAK